MQGSDRPKPCKTFTVFFRRMPNFGSDVRSGGEIMIKSTKSGCEILELQPEGEGRGRGPMQLFTTVAMNKQKAVMHHGLSIAFVMVLKNRLIDGQNMLHESNDCYSRSEKSQRARSSV